MLDLVAENSVLRLVLLVLLFALVAAVAYLAVQSLIARQFAKRRLVEVAGPSSATVATGSLRNERIESAWLKLVNSIERKGLSLVDTKDVSLRHNLIAAGFTATYAPRLYTLIRLVLVAILPLLVLTFFWLTASSPSIAKLYFSLVIAAAMGLYIPSLFVRVRAEVASGR